MAVPLLRSADTAVTQMRSMSIYWLLVNLNGGSRVILAVSDLGEYNESGNDIEVQVFIISEAQTSNDDYPHR